MEQHRLLRHSRRAAGSGAQSHLVQLCSFLLPGLDWGICANDVLLLNHSGIDFGRGKLGLAKRRRLACDLAKCQPQS